MLTQNSRSTPVEKEMLSKLPRNTDRITKEAHNAIRDAVKKALDPILLSMGLEVAERKADKCEPK